MLRVGFSRALAATALAAALTAAAAAPVLAQETRPREPVITVTGEGRADVAPDMAVVDLGVVKDGKTAREALDANNAAMAEVMKALKDAGIAERDLQTSGFVINPQYQFPQGDGNENKPPVLVGFQVSNMLSVRIRDLAKLGTILDQTVTLGVNQSGGIRFTNDKPEAAISEARKKAVEDGIARARELTSAAGIDIGKVLEISETSYRAQPMPMMRAAMAKDFAPEAVPVAAGENSYSVTVTMTFELKN
ncbi:SIMPL domain-containing protein [Rhizobium sp. TRM96647]|uniref:SIMPL domain-containing protein n=1 Tax=unclassified Rhizobium TaxID=2613769 RepID=UPI0021E9623D|nr:MULTISPECIES: SIMPL domain-containing protein [unclassified Rhizobium]MCV3737967.1 SIMPL domain-containing protein [Rhizobium sp. TRM96647]MCV3759654.1 SIMPL domain-containing protein [Rhizobium sp. TRM96650]